MVHLLTKQIDRGCFRFFIHIFDCDPRKPGFEPLFKPCEVAAKWGNYILLLLLRTLKISLKHGRTNVCNMCAVCCVMFSRVWLTWCLPQMNHRGTVLWLQSFSCCGGLIGHSAEGLLPFQSLHMELHCCYRHKSFALRLYNFFGVKGAWMLGGAALQRIIRYNILQFNTLAIVLLLWHWFT